MSKEIELSVVVPTFNRERFLRQTILSLLQEQLSGVEIIVVDDASTDRSLEVVKDLPIRLIQQPRNLGPSVARNTGVRVSKGQFVTFFDSDDILNPGGLRERLNYLKSHRNHGVVSGLVAGAIDEAGKRFQVGGVGGGIESVPADFLTLEYFKAGGRFCCGLWKFMFRRDFLNEVGAFDERLWIASDSEYVFRILSREVIPVIPIPVLWYRVHRENISVKVENERLIHPSKVLAETLLVNLEYGIRIPSWGA